MPIGKRELASYLLLYSSGKEVMSIEYAKELLGLMLPGRAVRSVIRILARSGFIEVRSKDIKIHRLEEALTNYLSSYIRSRVERNMRSRHIQHRIELEPGSIEKIYIEGVRCREKTDIAIGRVKIIC